MSTIMYNSWVLIFIHSSTSLEILSVLKLIILIVTDCMYILIFSSICGGVGPPLTFNEVMNNCVIHPVSKAWCLGRTIQCGRIGKTDLISAILESAKGKLIVNGNVGDQMLLQNQSQRTSYSLPWQYKFTCFMHKHNFAPGYLNI